MPFHALSIRSRNEVHMATINKTSLSKKNMKILSNTFQFRHLTCALYVLSTTTMFMKVTTKVSRASKQHQTGNRIKTLLSGNGGFTETANLSQVKILKHPCGKSLATAK